MSCSLNIQQRQDSPEDLRIKKLNTIDELLQNREIVTAKKNLDKYIKEFPEDLRGYRKLCILFHYADYTPEQIMKENMKYTALFNDIYPPDSLKLQVDYLFRQALDDTSSTQILDTLIVAYPTCSIIDDYAQEEVFGFAVMRDDSLRSVGLEEFLQTFPDNKWAALGWRYLLYSYENLGNAIKIDSVLTAIELRYPDELKMIHIIARTYLDRKEKLEYYVDRLSGLIDSLELEDWNKSFYFFGDKSRTEQLATYRFTLAELLYEQGNYQEALHVLKAVNVENISAQHLYLRGKTEIALEQKALAFTHLIDAVIVGDERNYWTPKADSLLHDLYDDFSDGGKAFRSFVNVWAKYKEPLFVDVTMESGLGGYRKSRIAWGDYNNDGFDDILLNGNTLLKNNDDGTFTNVSDSVGIFLGKTNGGVWADFDRDGWLDFFASSSSSDREDRLWKNDRGRTFIDMTAYSSLADTLQTEGSAWGDINGDLYPDLYIANYEHGGIYDKEPDFLFINNADGSFSEVSIQWQIIPPFNEDQAGRGVNWGDYNNDGFLDIFVSNYRLDKNFLWKNVKGKFFDNVSQKVGVEGTYVEGWYGHTIGSEWGDFDNDGDLDLICANLAHPRYIEFSDMTQLFVNDLKKNRFYDIRENTGITYDECHSDPSWGDVNGDGYLDLFITSIYPNRRSYLYLNNGDKTFTDVTYLAGVRTFNSWGAAYSDYDNDGDIDLLVCSNDGIHLFRNDTDPEYWLKVQINDENGLTPIIGTRIEVQQGNLVQLREVQGGKGTTNQHSMVQYFGFPNAESVDIKIHFLDGTSRMIHDQDLQQKIKIYHNQQ